MVYRSKGGVLQGSLLWRMIGFICLVAVLLLTARVLWKHEEKQQANRYGSQMLRGMRSFSTEAIMSLQGDPDDVNRVEYLRLKRHFDRIVANSTLISGYAFFRMGQAGEFVYLLESSKPGVKSAKPGQRIVGAPEAFREAFESRRIKWIGRGQDEAGRAYYYGIAPLIDFNTGKIVAAVGKISEAFWLEKLWQSMFLPLILLSMIGFWGAVVCFFPLRRFQKWLQSHGIRIVRLEVLLVLGMGMTLSFLAAVILLLEGVQQHNRLFVENADVRATQIRMELQRMTKLELDLFARTIQHAEDPQQTFHEIAQGMDIRNTVQGWAWIEVNKDRSAFVLQSCEPVSVKPFFEQVVEEVTSSKGQALGRSFFDVFNTPFTESLRTKDQEGGHMAYVGMRRVGTRTDPKGVVLVWLNPLSMLRTMSLSAAGYSSALQTQIYEERPNGRAVIAECDIPAKECVGGSPWRRAMRQWDTKFPLFAFGRTLIVRSMPTEIFLDDFSIRNPLLTLCLGMMLTCLMSVATWYWLKRPERLEREVTARNSEMVSTLQRYRRMSTYTKAFCWQLDRQGYFTDLDPVADTLYAFRSDDYIDQRHLCDLFTSLSKEVVEAKFAYLIEHPNESEQFVHPLKDARGITRFVGTRMLPCFEADVCTGFVGITQDVTKQYEAQQDFSEMFETIKEGVVIYEPLENEQGEVFDFKILNLNTATESFTGRTAADLIGRKVSEINDGRNLPSLIAGYQQLKLTGSCYQTPDPIYFPECSRHLRVSLYQIARGRICSLSTDVSEAVAHMKEIETTSNRLKLLLNNLTGFVFRIVKRDGVYITECFSEAIERMLGYPVVFFDGEPTSKMGTYLVPNFSQEESTKLLDSLFKKWAKPISRDLYVHRRDGSECWMLEQLRPVHDEHGNMTFIEVFVLDVTERKKTELEVHQNARLLCNVLENVHGVIWFYDVDQEKFVFVSRSVEKLFGITDRQIKSDTRDYPVSKEFKTFYQGLLKEIKIAREKDAIDYLSLKTVQVEQEKMDGTRFMSEVSYHFSKNPDTGHLEIHGSTLDISQRINLEQENNRIREQLSRSNKMESLGRLAGGIAHDFNNMLQAIQGYAEIGLTECPAGSDLVTDLREIISVSQRAAALTKQLLLFSRKRTVAPSIVDVKGTFEVARNTLVRLIGYDIKLTLHADKDCGAIRIDPNAFDQALVNLCLNAKDAIDKTSATHEKRIDVSARIAVFDHPLATVHGQLPAGIYVAISVTDTGIGMTSKIADQIFEPFFTTKSKSKGSGLGLASVFGIVAQANGGIVLKTKPNEGSTFTVYLPRYKQEETVKQTPAEPDVAALTEENSKAPKGHEKILIVDDEEAILAATERILQSLGYSTQAVSEPSKAIAAISISPTGYQCVVSDVLMPEMNGPEMMKEIRKIVPNLPCLYISGYTANLLNLHEKIQLAEDFLPKPFNRTTLAKKLREKLDAARDQG